MGQEEFGTATDNFSMNEGLLKQAAKDAIRGMIEVDVRRNAETYRGLLWKRVREASDNEELISRLIQIGAETNTGSSSMVINTSTFQFNQRVVIISELGGITEPKMYRVGGFFGEDSILLSPGEINLQGSPNAIECLSILPMRKLLGYKAFQQIQYALGEIVNDHYRESLTKCRYLYFDALKLERPGIDSVLDRLLVRVFEGKRKYRETLESSRRLLSEAKEKLLDILTIDSLTKNTKRHAKPNDYKIVDLVGIAVNMGRDLEDGDFGDYQYVRNVKMRLDFPDIKYEGIIFIDKDAFDETRKAIEKGLLNRREKLRKALLKGLSA
jgi:hypothetical protein